MAHTRGGSSPLSIRDRLKMATILTILGLVCLGATCGACGTAAILPRVTAPTIYRGITAQWAAAVTVKTSCHDGTTRFGTGVIVSSDVVLTARHVVVESWLKAWDEATHTGTWKDCDDLHVTVIEVDGNEHTGVVEGESQTADVARIRIADWFKDAPAEMGPRPALGSVVCVVAMVPAPWRRCGQVQAGTGQDQIRADIPVEHGNSGAAMYDSQGRVVGIMTLQEPGERGQIMGGTGTALASVPFLWPRE